MKTLTTPEVDERAKGGSDSGEDAASEWLKSGEGLAPDDAGDAAASADPHRRAARLPVRILLADNHPIFLSSLKTWFDQHAEFEVVGETDDADDVVLMAQELRPDCVVLDIRMPNEADGFRAARTLTEMKDGPAVLMLSIYASGEYVRSVFNAGARGYVTKEDAPEHLVRGIQSILKGRRYASPRVAEILLDELLFRPEKLSGRELETLRLMSRGLSARDIGRQLGIAERTVGTYKQNIFRKLGVHSTAQAIYRGRELGLVVDD